jgi:hypothetical protein
MLNLIYNIKCGFKDLYVKENNVVEDLSSWVDILNDSLLPGEIKFTEEELYEQYHDDVETLLDELFYGATDLIWEATMLRYSKTFFKHICYADPKKAFIPDFCDLTNFRIVLEDDVAVNPIEHKESLKASEVMALLNISRPTLCHYVKRGLIKVDTNYTGKQYRYNKDSVLSLMKGSK